MTVSGDVNLRSEMTWGRSISLGIYTVDDMQFSSFQRKLPSGYIFNNI